MQRQAIKKLPGIVYRIPNISIINNLFTGIIFVNTRHKYFMRKVIIFIFCSVCYNLFGQNTDSFSATKAVYVYKDPRLNILARKEAEVNELTAKLLERTAMGYRLQVLSTNDRELAMKIKADLLQKFPEQKVYMFYQSPFVKIRFGNFKIKQEADIYKKQISRMLGGASIYYVPERIEVKPEKDFKENDQ